MLHCPRCYTELTHGTVARGVVTCYCPACTRDYRILLDPASALPPAAHAAVNALEALAQHTAVPDQPWPATAAALRTLFAALDAYTLHRVRTGLAGPQEAAVYQAWRTAELAQLAAIEERKALEGLLAEVDVEGLLRTPDIP